MDGSKLLLLLLLLPLFFLNNVQSSPIPSLSQPHFAIDIPPKESFEATLPLPTDHATPKCSVDVLTHTFQNTSSISVIYTPPPFTCRWSHAVLQYRAQYKGEQYGSIAGVWIDGVELLRTSTAHPTDDGVLWNVRKDVTRYSSFFTRKTHALSVMLGNLENDVFTGVYQVNVSFLFYSAKAVRFPLSVVSGEAEAHTLKRKLISVDADSLEVGQAIKSLYPYDTPADSIVPISGAPEEGYWFKIQDEFDVPTTSVRISRRTYKAVLELYVSSHGDDELWYMNPSDSYIEENHLDTRSGHGSYREVLVTIDGKLVGTVIPFPLIYPSGINPQLWDPVVSIGAFDLPSYDVDFTPYLGFLLDSKNHSIGIHVADSISFWLVGANLHLWSGRSIVNAENVKLDVPDMRIHRHNHVQRLNADLELEGERASECGGWVSSSAGFVKTQMIEKTKFQNKLQIKKEGAWKELNHETTRKIKIRTENIDGDVIFDLEVKLKYPLKVNIESVSNRGFGVMTVRVVQEHERSNMFDGESIVMNHSQNTTGSVAENPEDSFLPGSTDSHQRCNYQDRYGCQTRKVDVKNGDVVTDVTAPKCA